MEINSKDILEQVTENVEMRTVNFSLPKGEYDRLMEACDSAKAKKPDVLRALIVAFNNDFASGGAESAESLDRM